MGFHIGLKPTWKRNDVGFKIDVYFSNLCSFILEKRTKAAD